MNVARETILTSLFTLLQTAAVFETLGRRLIHWSQVTAQPAIFLRDIGDEYGPRQGWGVPAEVTMETEVWIYSKTADPDQAPSTNLNNLIDAVEAVLRPSPAIGVLNLGGIVQHCWIEGKIEKSPGDQGNQAIAVIPVKILTL